MQIASLFASIGADTSGLQKGLKDSENAIKKTAKSVEKSGESFNFAAMATGFNQALEIVGKVTRGVQQAYAAIAEGAQLEYAAEKFDRLSQSIGTTSELLLDDLKSATRGMMSDAQLMGSAGDLMALGLVKTHDEAVRLTNVAGALGMNMNQLVLTLTNQTTMRFDSLGVSVDGFTEKVKALEDAGMSANDAFKEAFLQQAEEQIEKVGNIADTSAGQLMALNAEAENLRDTFLQLFASSDFVKSAMGLLKHELTDLKVVQAKGQFNDLRDTLYDLGLTSKQLSKFSGFKTRWYGSSLEEDMRFLDDAAVSMENFGKLLDWHTRLQKDFGYSAEGASVKLQQMIDTFGVGILEDGGQSWADVHDRVWDTTQTATAGMISMREAAIANQERLSQWREELHRTAEALRTDLADAYIQVSIAEQGWREGVSGDLKGRLDEEFERHKISLDKYKASLDILDRTYGTNYVMQFEMELAMDDLFRTLLENPEDFADAAGAFEDYFMPLDAAVQASMELVDDLQARLSELERTYDAKVNIVIATYGYGSTGSLPIGGDEGGGGGSKVPQFAHAMGGYELAGQPYLVGEAGPELFIPDTNGRVYSNSSSSAMLGGGNGDLLAALGRLPTASDIALAVRDALLMVGA